MRPTFLTTPRLAFSTWQPGDLDLARTLWGEPQVTHLICASGRFSDAEIAARLDSEIENGALYQVQYWPIFQRQTEMLVGCCGLRPVDLEARVYELGFHLKSQYWGQRYAQEAAAAVLSHAFGPLHAAAVLAGHHPQNAASKKVLLRLGFLYSHEEYYPPTGLFHPSYRLENWEQDASAA